MGGVEIGGGVQNQLKYIFYKKTMDRPHPPSLPPHHPHSKRRTLFSLRVAWRGQMWCRGSEGVCRVVGRGSVTGGMRGGKGEGGAEEVCGPGRRDLVVWGGAGVAVGAFKGWGCGVGEVRGEGVVVGTGRGAVCPWVSSLIYKE